MKKLFSLCFFMILCSVIVYGQEEEKPSHFYQTSAQFQQIDFTDFNSQLSDLNLLPLSNNTVEIGAGITSTFRRFVTDASVVFGIEESRLANDLSGPNSRFRFVGLRIGEGINVLNPEGNWFLGPEFALNLSFQQILVTGRNNGTNFQQAALNTVYSFDRFAATTDVGLSVYKVIEYNDMFDFRRRAMIRLRAGYRVDVEDEYWNLNKAIVQENLGVDVSGWYGAIIFAINLY